MKARNALVLVALAVAVAIHFWPDDPSGQGARHEVQGDPPQRVSSTKPSDNAIERPAQKSGDDASAARPQPNGSPMLSGPSGAPARITVRGPSRVHAGEPFQVIVDVDATRGIQQVAFSVDFSATVMQFTGSSPGVLAQNSRAGAGFFAEESSDGALLVRVDFDNGSVIGAGSVAVLDFRAVNPGESPLTIHSISYLESGRQEESTVPAGYEGTITVD